MVINSSLISENEIAGSSSQKQKEKYFDRYFAFHSEGVFICNVLSLLVVGFIKKR